MPKMFGAKFPLPVQNEKLVFSSGNAVVAAGATTYLNICDQGGEFYGGVQATEGNILNNYFVTRGGLLRNLVANCITPPGVGETFTYTIRINGVPTVVTCQIAGAVAQNANDLVNTAEVVVGDIVTIQIVASAAAVVSSHCAGLQFSVPSMRIPFEHVSFGTGTTTIPANTTGYISSVFRFFPLTTGAYGSTETITRLTHLVTRKGSLKNLVVLAGAAPGAGQTFVYTVRVNAVNTAMTVTLSGAAQVTGTDIVNVVQVDVGDRITLRVVTSLAAAAATHAASFDFEEGDYRAG